MSSKINLQTCEYARKSSIFQDNQLIWNKIDADLYKQTMQNIDSHIPNIVTSITFALYFISFYIRSYFKKREAFITSFNKKFHHPYN